MKRSLAIAVLGGAALLASAVSALSFRLPRAPESTGSSAIAREALSQRSLYQLSSRWVTDQGRSVELFEMAGKYLVLAMIFTSCPSECPTLVKDLQRLERSLPRTLLAQTQFVLVSIDPERDTPGVLRRYAERMDLDPEHWTLLHGRAEDVRELSAVLGVSYGQSGAGLGLVHAKLVTVLNRQGEVLAQQAGVRDDPERIVRAIERAVAAEVRP